MQDIIIRSSKLEQLKRLSDEEKIERKENMLLSCENQSDSDLVHHILAGIFTLQDLEKHMESDSDRFSEIENWLANYVSESTKAQRAEELRRLNEVKAEVRLDERRQKAELFLQDYPNGTYLKDAHQILIAIEDEVWQNVQKANEFEIAQALDLYLKKYPQGRYLHEAISLQEDLPWAIVKMNPSLSKLYDYKSKYPNRHTTEVDALISDIEDEKDWADVKGDRDRAKAYKTKHPHGKYIAEADRIMNRPPTEREEFLKNLRLDRNYYTARRIQEKLNNYQLSREDLSEIFTDDEIDAILAYQLPKKLPEVSPKEDLLPDFTEVYFWGTKGTGKTCAMGAILSAANKFGIFNPIDGCAGGMYLTNLSGLFTSNDICTLPDSTATRSIPEMTFSLKDSNGRPHKMMFIDCAGEICHAMYKEKNVPNALRDDEKASLQRIQKYLTNSHNSKIHIFVIEYGRNKANEQIDPDELPGVHQINVLQAMANYMREHKIFRTSTVGVYCLVTKCDQLKCSIDKRPEEACQYVVDNYTSFWDHIVDDCEKFQIAECKTISFSIGDVFARNLCKFKDEDTSKVIRKLLAKTPAQRAAIIESLSK